MQVSAIPTGPTYYQPIAAVPPVAPVVGRLSDAQAAGETRRAATPPGVGGLLDIDT